MNSIVDFPLKSVDEGKFFCWRIVSRAKIGIASSNSLWSCEKCVQLIWGVNNVVVHRLSLYRSSSIASWQADLGRENASYTVGWIGFFFEKAYLTDG
jgi:hypothetical protein